MNERLVHAPDFGRFDLPWFNVPKRLGLDELSGRLVILDFWTFCCINCMQILPTLRRIEEAFPEDVVVIGVHSPKFAAEREPEKVKAAIARYDIRHPVVHDPEMIIWKHYGVRAWPTLVFISPDGYVIGHAPGEPDPDRLLEVVGQVIRAGKTDGTIQGATLDLTLQATPLGPLLFPSKLKPLPMPNGEPRWALADAGHHQIIELDANWRERARYGSGQPGFDDGARDQASFNAPQGLIADEQSIYVADTGNHAIRRIDRKTGAITTLAGTGARGPRLTRPMPGAAIALASVWDLELNGDALYFANAGSHQIGVLDLADGTVKPLAGTGGENIEDGRAPDALLAQPSGLSLSPDGTRLAFADSETSAIRLLDLAGTGPVVRTLIGTGLFDFGHQNGPLGEALLQHPLGVIWLDDQRLAVADSYNNAVRLIYLKAGTIDDLDDGSFVCQDSLCLPLGEPAGVAVDAEGRILVSDTNNHRIVAYDPIQRTYQTVIG
ncbi:MAG: redoxin domain-containing protein [Alphaproteobacteria bacterium]|nr:redoxin domain-containing protein [Alphaproteobacteria bacterium]